MSSASASASTFETDAIELVSSKKCMTRIEAASVVMDYLSSFSIDELIEITFHGVDFSGRRFLINQLLRRILPKVTSDDVDAAYDKLQPRSNGDLARMVDAACAADGHTADKLLARYITEIFMVWCNDPVMDTRTYSY